MCNFWKMMLFIDSVGSIAIYSVFLLASTCSHHVGNRLLKHQITTKTLSGPRWQRALPDLGAGTRPGSFSASHWHRVAAPQPPLAPGTNSASLPRNTKQARAPFGGRYLITHLKQCLLLCDTMCIYDATPCKRRLAWHIGNLSSFLKVN